MSEKDAQKDYETLMAPAGGPLTPCTSPLVTRRTKGGGTTPEDLLFGRTRTPCDWTNKFRRQGGQTTNPSDTKPLTRVHWGNVCCRCYAFPPFVVYELRRGRLLSLHSWPSSPHSTVAIDNSWRPPDSDAL